MVPMAKFESHTAATACIPVREVWQPPRLIVLPLDSAEANAGIFSEHTAGS